MNITDTGTVYFEVAVVDNRNMDTIIQTVENVWICPHGVLKAISAED